MISRRQFVYNLFAAVAAGAVLDTDKLLWVPGEKKIVIAPAIHLVTVNLGQSRAIGMFHDGKANPWDVLTTVPFSTLPPAVREHWEHLNPGGPRVLRIA